MKCQDIHKESKSIMEEFEKLKIAEHDCCYQEVLLDEGEYKKILFELFNDEAPDDEIEKFAHHMLKKFKSCGARAFLVYAYPKQNGDA